MWNAPLAPGEPIALNIGTFRAGGTATSSGSVGFLRTVETSPGGSGGDGAAEVRSTVPGGRGPNRPETGRLIAQVAWELSPHEGTLVWWVNLDRAREGE